MEFLDFQILNNSFEQWLLALLTAGITLLILWGIKRLLIHRLQALAGRTDNNLDDLLAEAVRATKIPVLIVVALYVGSFLLSFEPLVRDWMWAITFIVILLQVGLWADKGVQVWLRRYSQAHLEDEAGDVTTMRALIFVMRLVIFSILFLIGLDNIPGVDITALIASLGIGGIAIALAVQNILGDLFASLSISLDKPFVIGDFIEVGDYKGRVEEIGIKTTRVRSISGEQVIFSNSDLLDSRIRNFKRMEERRVSLTIGVSYDTPAEKLRRIPEMVAGILNNIDEVRFERVHFKSMGDFSLNYEVVYHVTRPDIDLHMNILQEFNLALFEIFAAEAIEFPFPTQTVLLNQESPFNVQTREDQEEAALTVQNGQN